MPDQPPFPPTPNPTDHALRKHRLERADLEFYPWWHVPVVRILIVTDGSGAFDVFSSFGLGLMLSALRSEPWWWVRFEIVTAHRRSGTLFTGTADHQDFRFDAPPAGIELSTFDEIWLFGVEGRRDVGDPPPAAADRLQPAEIAAVRAFMDAGGGVFATGDHFGLGENMCAELPRVSKMRRWAPGGPVGDPPQPVGEHRYDTVREGPTTGFQFDDQSDDVPQPIFPTRYDDWRLSTALVRRWRPHPVLCGIAGIIDVLPDHMHENRIVQPSAAIAADATEWPGNQPHEVIATARVIPHTNTDGFGFTSGPVAEEGLPAGEFGVLGAYDGHPQSVGRIVVDATWHHWFNVNLRGFDTASAHFAHIRNYYWNVALWLAGKDKQQTMFNTAGHGLGRLQPWNELSPATDVEWLGFSGLDAIGRRASQCVAVEWLLDRLPWKLRERFRWPPVPGPRNPPDPAPIEGYDRLLELVLGGIVREHMRLRDGAAAWTKDDAATIDERLERASAHGAAEGLREFARYRKRQIEAGRRALAEVERALGTAGSA
jgi:hypothetical protein